jgi:hypothetical protein
VFFQSLDPDQQARGGELVRHAPFQSPGVGLPACGGVRLASDQGSGCL